MRDVISVGADKFGEFGRSSIESPQLQGGVILKQSQFEESRELPVTVPTTTILPLPIQLHVMLAVMLSNGPLLTQPGFQRPSVESCCACALDVLAIFFPDFLVHSRLTHQRTQRFHEKSVFCEVLYS